MNLYLPYTFWQVPAPPPGCIVLKKHFEIWMWLLDSPKSKAWPHHHLSVWILPLSSNLTTTFLFNLDSYWFYFCVQSLKSFYIIIWIAWRCINIMSMEMETEGPLSVIPLSEEMPLLSPEISNTNNCHFSNPTFLHQMPSVPHSKLQREFESIDFPNVEIASLDITSHGCFVLAGCSNGMVLLFDLTSNGRYWTNEQTNSNIAISLSIIIS